MHFSLLLRIKCWSFFIWQGRQDTVSNFTNVAWAFFIFYPYYWNEDTYSGFFRGSVYCIPFQSQINLIDKILLSRISSFGTSVYLPIMYREEDILKSYPISTGGFLEETNVLNTQLILLTFWFQNSDNLLSSFRLESLLIVFLNIVCNYF